MHRKAEEYCSTKINLHEDVNSKKDENRNCDWKRKVQTSEKYDFYGGPVLEVFWK